MLAFRRSGRVTPVNERHLYSDMASGHLVNVIHDLTSRGIGLKVLSGQGAAIDTTTPAGKPAAVSASLCRSSSWEPSAFDTRM
jgi:hypothetical protein